LVLWPSVDIHGKLYGGRSREPLRRGGGLNARGVAKYSDFGPIEGYHYIRNGQGHREFPF